MIQLILITCVSVVILLLSYSLNIINLENYFLDENDNEIETINQNTIF